MTEDRNVPSNDVVQRLRALCGCKACCLEAADEIDRLRAALKRIVSFQYAAVDQASRFTVCEIARGALGPADETTASTVLCGEPGPQGFICERTKGHPGRHDDSAGRRWGTAVETSGYRPGYHCAACTTFDECSKTGCDKAPDSAY